MTNENIDIDSEKQLNGFTGENTIASVEKQIKEEVTKEVSDAPKTEVNAHVDVAPHPINNNNQQPVANRWPENTPSDNYAEEYVKPEMYSGIWFYLLCFAPVIAFAVLFYSYIIIIPKDTKLLNIVVAGSLWIVDAVLIILDEKFLKKSHDEIDFKWKIIGILFGSIFYVIPRAISKKKWISLSIFSLIVLLGIIGYISSICGLFSGTNEWKTDYKEPLKENTQTSSSFFDENEDFDSWNNDSNEQNGYDAVGVTPTPIPTPTSIPVQTKTKLDTLWDDKLIDIDTSEYILYGSNYLLLEESDLYGLSENECRIARNEIYARHGRKFSSDDLQSYFNKRSWYYGYINPDDFDDSNWLNDIEKANIKLIKEYEDSGKAELHQNGERNYYFPKIIAFQEGAPDIFSYTAELFFLDKYEGCLVIDIEDEEDEEGRKCFFTTYYFTVDDDLRISLYDGNQNVLRTCEIIKTTSYDGIEFWCIDFSHDQWNNIFDRYLRGSLGEKYYITHYTG